jgi:hypothetical protein
MRPLLYCAAAVLFWDAIHMVGRCGVVYVAPALAHKPPRLLSAQLAQATADQRTLRCQGFLGDWQPGQQPAPRFVGGGRHYRTVVVTTLNGHLEVFVWRVRIKHDQAGAAAVGKVQIVASTSLNWQACL